MSQPAPRVCPTFGQFVRALVRGKKGGNEALHTHPLFLFRFAGPTSEHQRLGDDGRLGAPAHTAHAHTHTPTHTFSLHPHHITMSSSDFLLPEKWSEGLLDEAGAPMSKTCV